LFKFPRRHDNTLAALSWEIFIFLFIRSWNGTSSRLKFWKQSIDSLIKSTQPPCRITKSVLKSTELIQVTSLSEPGMKIQTLWIMIKTFETRCNSPSPIGTCQSRAH
uniref:Ovule protein n=1 Tax=Hymenolepis diminuta TaxID=6216 RepID=A0A158QDB0_HYMDI